MLRPATVSDAPMLAAIEMTTAPEFANFIFTDLRPGTQPGVLAAVHYANPGPDGHEWSWIAEARLPGGALAAAAAMTAHPVSMLPPPDPADPAAERLTHLSPLRAALDADSFHIARIGVLEPFRRKGVASELVRTAIDTARGAKKAAVSLYVWEDNAPARALYERLGFAETQKIDIAPHPRLERSGAMLKMRLAV